MEELIKSSAHIAQSDLRTVSADKYALHTLIYDSFKGVECNMTKDALVTHREGKP